MFPNVFDGISQAANWRWKVSTSNFKETNQTKIKSENYSSGVVADFLFGAGEIQFFDLSRNESSSWGLFFFQSVKKRIQSDPAKLKRINVPAEKRCHSVNSELNFKSFCNEFNDEFATFWTFPIFPSSQGRR